MEDYPEQARNLADVERPVSALDQAVMEHDMAIESLSKTLSRLEDRLTPLVNPNSLGAAEMAKDPSNVTEKANSKIVNDLKSKTRSVRQIDSRIGRIISTLEV